MPAANDAQVLDALRQVQALTPPAFESALSEEVGQPTIALFHALARGLHPDDSDDAIAKKIHLMVLSWLVARRTP